MRIAFVIFLFCIAGVAEAHQPLLPQPTGPDDLVRIERPEVSWAYYGELQGFPHTYEIVATSTFNLYVQISEPAIAGAAKDHAVIIVRERDNGRGVEEVARLHPGDTNWESWYEPFGGDSYLRGPEFEAEVKPGTYRIEVSTSVNDGKYVLAVGKREDFSGVGYFETVGKIYQVKRFFEKPGIAIVQSPFVYVPLAIISIIAVGVYYWRRRRHA